MNDKKDIIAGLKNKNEKLLTENYLMRRTLESLKLKVDNALTHKYGRGLM